MASLMESVLSGTYSTTKKLHGMDARTPLGMRGIMSDIPTFKTYLRGLCEGLNEKDKRTFVELAKNTRQAILTEVNAVGQIPAYETFVLPVLRNFYPRLIAKELVNVMPIDKPVVIQGFIKPKFATANSSSYSYGFPSMSTDISTGPSVGISTTQKIVSNTVNILTDTTAGMSLTSGYAHLERKFAIVGIYDRSGVLTTLDATSGNSVEPFNMVGSIYPDVDGNFSCAVTHNGSGASGSTDTVFGNVNYLSGVFTWQSVSGSGTTSGLKIQAVASLEENQINPSVEFDVQKIQFVTRERKIQARWSLNIEQDAKALYDIQLQSELVNIMGEQIAIDIDREIVNELISINSSQNPSTHSVSFNVAPPSGYAFGPKEWIANLLPVVNALSATIYNDTMMQEANTIACNPLDAALFASLNSYEYLGGATAGGEVGYREAKVANGLYRVLSSNIVPAGTMIVKYRSEELQRAAYVYAPYVPALLSPYPLGANPSMSILSRYSTKSIRPLALGTIAITNSAPGSYPTFAV